MPKVKSWLEKVLNEIQDLQHLAQLHAFSALELEVTSQLLFCWQEDRNETEKPGSFPLGQEGIPSALVERCVVLPVAANRTLVKNNRVQWFGVLSNIFVNNCVVLSFPID